MVVSIGDWILTHFFMWNDFDASRKGRVKKKKVSVKGAKQAVIFYPYWTGKSSFYKGFAKKFPDATHIFYDYPNEVYSENVDVSLNYILEILSDSVRLIGELRREGIEEIVLVGSSFGSNIAFKLATMIKVEKVVLNMMDRDFANAIFKSPALGLLRKKLEYQGFTLSKLQKLSLIHI